MSDINRVNQHNQTNATGEQNPLTPDAVEEILAQSFKQAKRLPAAPLTRRLIQTIQEPASITAPLSLSKASPVIPEMPRNQFTIASDLMLNAAPSTEDGSALNQLFTLQKTKDQSDYSFSDQELSSFLTQHSKPVSKLVDDNNNLTILLDPNLSIEVKRQSILNFAKIANPEITESDVNAYILLKQFQRGHVSLVNKFAREVSIFDLFNRYHRRTSGSFTKQLAFVLNKGINNYRRAHNYMTEWVNSPQADVEALNAEKSLLQTSMNFLPLDSQSSSALEAVSTDNREVFTMSELENYFNGIGEPYSDIFSKINDFGSIFDSNVDIQSQINEINNRVNNIKDLNLTEEDINAIVFLGRAQAGQINLLNHRGRKISPIRLLENNQNNNLSFPEKLRLIAEANVRNYDLSMNHIKRWYGNNDPRTNQLKAGKSDYINEIVSLLPNLNIQDEAINTTDINNSSNAVVDLASGFSADHGKLLQDILSYPRFNDLFTANKDAINSQKQIVSRLASQYGLDQSQETINSMIFLAHAASNTMQVVNRRGTKVSFEDLVAQSNLDGLSFTDSVKTLSESLVQNYAKAKKHFKKWLGSGSSEYQNIDSQITKLKTINSSLDLEAENQVVAGDHNTIVENFNRTELSDFIRTNFGEGFANLYDSASGHNVLSSHSTMAERQSSFKQLSKILDIEANDAEINAILLLAKIQEGKLATVDRRGNNISFIDLYNDNQANYSGSFTDKLSGVLNQAQHNFERAINYRNKWFTGSETMVNELSQERNDLSQFLSDYPITHYVLNTNISNTSTITSFDNAGLAQSLKGLGKNFDKLINDSFTDIFTSHPNDYDQQKLSLRGNALRLNVPLTDAEVNSLVLIGQLQVGNLEIYTRKGRSASIINLLHEGSNNQSLEDKVNEISNSIMRSFDGASSYLNKWFNNPDKVAEINTAKAQFSNALTDIFGKTATSTTSSNSSVSINQQLNFSSESIKTFLSSFDSAFGTVDFNSFTNIFTNKPDDINYQKDEIRKLLGTGLSINEHEINSLVVLGQLQVGNVNTISRLGSNNSIIDIINQNNIVVSQGQSFNDELALALNDAFQNFDDARRFTRTWFGNEHSRLDEINEKQDKLVALLGQATISSQPLNIITDGDASSLISSSQTVITGTELKDLLVEQDAGFASIVDTQFLKNFNDAFLNHDLAYQRNFIQTALSGTELAGEDNVKALIIIGNAQVKNFETVNWKGHSRSFFNILDRNGIKPNENLLQRVLRTVADSVKYYNRGETSLLKWYNSDDQPVLDLINKRAQYFNKLEEIFNLPINTISGLYDNFLNSVSESDIRTYLSSASINISNTATLADLEAALIQVGNLAAPASVIDAIRSEIQHRIANESYVAA